MKYKIFGIDEVGDTYCLFVNNFKPFFYIEVDDDWTRNEVNQFYNKIREEVTKYYSDSILQCKLIQKKRLYGFDNDKYYNFIFIEFENIMVFNKVKSLYFEEGNLKKEVIHELWKKRDKNKNIRVQYSPIA